MASRPGPAPASGLQLARTVREHFLAEAGAALQQIGAVAQQRLVELVDEPANARDNQLRRDVWMAFKRCGPVWQEGTLRAWQACLGAPPQKISAQSSLAGLELVATDVAENKILASRLARVVTEKVFTQLDDLRIRIKFLENRDEPADADVLLPEVWVLRMVEQWVESGMPDESWPMVSDAVQLGLIAPMQAAYQNANAWLVAQGVMPVIELKDRVKGPVRGAGLPPDGESERRRQAREAAQPVPGYAAPDYPPEMSAPMVTPLARARSRAQAVVGQVKSLFASQGEADWASTELHTPSPALSQAVARQPAAGGTYVAGGTLYQDHSSAGLARVATSLRETSSELKNAAQSRGEKATIEMVALMFQSILAEDRIPPGIRVWFARLQMPVLRLALGEPDFLAGTTHPARLLIDRMGSCVMGFEAAAVQGGAIETEIKRIVQVIEQYPETGKKVYQVVFDEFQKFLASFLTENGPVKNVVSIAQQVEQKETLTIQYTIEMRNTLQEMPVRDEIRTFLFKVWAEVLAVAAMRHGPQHADTLALKKSTSDLVWAASAKPSRADRARVIQGLPGLLGQLRAGMTLLGMAAPEQDAQLKIVSDTLADAFMSKTQGIPQATIDALAERLGRLEDFISEDGVGDLPLDTESIEMMLGIDASAIEVVANGGTKPTAAMLAWAQELEVGSWYTFDFKGQVSQLQFAWCSERKHLNLFVATAGKSFLIQTGQLAAYLQAGLLLPQEEETLTVRATRDALARIEANPESLLG